MKQLRKVFEGIGEVRGFLFTQIKSSKKGYIYHVNDENNIHYEIFKKRSGTNPFSNKEAVFYPRSNSFGLWAWTFRDKKQAEDKLKTL